MKIDTEEYNNKCGLL